MLRNLLILLVFISFSANIGFVVHYLSTKHEQQPVTEVIRSNIQTTESPTLSQPLRSTNSPAVPTLAPSIPFLAINVDRNAIQTWLKDVSLVVTLSPIDQPTLLVTERPTDSSILPAKPNRTHTPTMLVFHNITTKLTRTPRPTMPRRTRPPTKPRRTRAPTVPTLAPVPVLRNVTTYFIPEEKKLEHPVCAWCNQQVSHFLIPHLPNFTYLASYPGSGNNWIISQLSVGSGLNHCSVYDYNGTFASHFDFHGCIITKTHFPFFTTAYDYKYPNEASIYLIRSPFDSILAELFRRNVQRDEISDVFPRYARKWKAHVDYHVGPKYWNNTKKYKRVDTAGTITFVRQGRRKQMIVFYEDFRTQQVQSMRNLFEFIKPSFGSSTPPVEDSVTCALETDRYLSGSQTSRGRKKVHLFAIEENLNLTRLACEMWADYWFEDMWGPCMDDSYRYYSKDVSLAVNASEEYKPKCYSALTKEMWV